MKTVDKRAYTASSARYKLDKNDIVIDDKYTGAVFEITDTYEIKLKHRDEVFL